MKLYLIRHLPTPYNLKGVLQGTKDISIAAIDKETTHEISENQAKIASIKFNAILSTELIRTKQTAALYNFNDTQTESLINELDFGKYEGQPKINFLNDLGDLWKNDPKSIILGESLVDFEKRLLAFLEKYKDQDHVLAFAHGGVIRALKSIEKIGSIDQMNTFEVHNNELFVLDFNQVKKRILILGGSKDQLPMIIRAKENGLYTIVADFNPNAIGKEYADEFYEVSIKDENAVFELAKNKNVDGICSMITEAGVLATYHACNKLNLPNPYSLLSAEATLSKQRMRQILVDNNINDLPFALPKTTEEAIAFGNSHGYPLVLKASDSGGQNGLFKVQNQKELEHYFPRSQADSVGESVIVEKYVAGSEINVVYTVFEGKIMDLIISDRIKHEDAFGIVNRHAYPSKWSSIYYDKMMEKCQAMTNALAIKNGVVFPQFIYSEALQEAILLEIGVRIPGGIMDQLMELASGINLQQFCLDASLGQLKSYEHYRQGTKQPCVMVTFLNATPGPLKVGKIEKVEGLEAANKISGIANLDYFFQTPDNLTITPLNKGRDRFFYILSYGPNISTAHQASYKVYKKLRFIDSEGNNLIKQNINFDRFYQYE